MIYRPQWAFPTPPNFRDEPWYQCLRAADTGSVAGSTTKSFVIPFDRDTEMWVCGMAIDAGKNFRSLGYQFTDAFGFYLSDDYVGSDLYAMPLGQNPDRGGGYVQTFNPPHYVPSNGIWQVSIKNFDNVAASIPDMEFRGFKRFPVICP